MKLIAHYVPIFLNAGLLFNQAVKTCEQIEIRKIENEPGHPQALVGILFAAISLEAFINEIPAVVRHIPLVDPTPDIILLADMLEAAEESRAQLEYKYQLARFVLTRTTFNKGSAPYQNFYKLIRLRNSIVHTRAEGTFKKDHKGRLIPADSEIVAMVRETGTILSNEEISQWKQSRGLTFVGTNWLDWISTKALGQWCCGAAAGMVLSILASLPDGSFADALKSEYRVFSSFNAKTQR